MNLGEAIKRLRKERKIKQKELAKSINISVNALLNIEKNLSFPSQNTLQNICKELNTSIAYLFISTLEQKDFPKDKQEIYPYLVEPLKKFLV